MNQLLPRQNASPPMFHWSLCTGHQSFSAVPLQSLQSALLAVTCASTWTSAPRPVTAGRGEACAAIERPAKGQATKPLCAKEQRHCTGCLTLHPQVPSGRSMAICCWTSGAILPLDCYFKGIDVISAALRSPDMDGTGTKQTCCRSFQQDSSSICMEEWQATSQ